MLCRICSELQQHLNSAQQPDSPELLLGLTEAGERNRIHQRQEKLVRAEMDIERHKKVCQSGLGHG